jgi:hypothetical protein
LKSRANTQNKKRGMKKNKISYLKNRKKERMERMEGAKSITSMNSLHYVVNINASCA